MDVRKIRHLDSEYDREAKKIERARSTRGFDRRRIVGKNDSDLDEFTCGICQDIFNEALVTNCCRQIYCKVCISQWLTANKSCPNDKRPLTLSDLAQPPRMVVNIVNKLNIKCDFAGKGCKATPFIEDLSRHVNNCPKRAILNCKTCGLSVECEETKNYLDNMAMKVTNLQSDKLAYIDEVDASNAEINKLKIELLDIKSVNDILHNDLKKAVTENEMFKYAIRELPDLLRGQLILKLENLCLKEEIAVIGNRGASGRNSKSVIVDAREHFNDYEIEEPSNKVSSREKILLLEACKLAIGISDTYADLSGCLYSLVRKVSKTDIWQAIAFSTDGGESLVNSEKYFRVKFVELVIELFTAAKSSSESASTS